MTVGWLDANRWMGGATSADWVYGYDAFSAPLDVASGAPA